MTNRLVGSWVLESRIDRAASGEVRPEPSLGSDPIAFLVFDSTGHFAAQFMKRDRKGAPDAPTVSGPTNNSRARGGYDAYFGSYTVDDARGELTTVLAGALSPENVGQTYVRRVSVEDDVLTLQLDTMTTESGPVTRTLRWRRVA